MPATAFRSRQPVERKTLVRDKQFVVFRLSDSAKGPTIVDCATTEPDVDGSTQEPDVRVGVDLLSFHVGRDVEVDADTRATMRINLGNEPTGGARFAETATWAIAAGLQLYDASNGDRPKPRDLNGDFRQALRRPIDIPNGLAKFSFEVVKHVEPPWWKKIFGIATSKSAEKLVSLLGFPALTTDAIRLLDELLDRVAGEKPEVLFSSQPLRFALSKQAKKAFLGKGARVMIGGLGSGFYVLARASDYSRIADAQASYDASHGILVPEGETAVSLAADPARDPLSDVTYAVFRFAVKAANLDQSIGLWPE